MRPPSVTGWRGSILFVVFPLIVLAALSADLAAQNYPTLTQVQQAILDSSASWTAGNTTVSARSWAEITKRCGTGEPPPGEDEGPFRVQLPDTLPVKWDWRNVNGKNYVSSIKDQDSCGSCWAFAACGALESLRKIKGYTGCGMENLSEQFMVSCCKGCGGCDGGNAKGTANCLRDTGTVDEACFRYVARDTACSNRCSDWASRIRKIDGWSYSSVLPRFPTVNELKTAVHKAPVWTTFLVHADFVFYKSGVYRKLLGPPIGGHAVLMIGYNDSTNAFLCKNSWGTGWGENGFFWMAYSTIPPGGSQFGRWTQDYSLAQATCYPYEPDDGAPYDWASVSGGAIIQGDDELLLVPLPFDAKYFCTMWPYATVSTNGWMCMGDYAGGPYWNHYGIPDPEGPPGMLAALWTDLLAPVGSESGVLYEYRPQDGTFVVEYRNMQHWLEPWYNETFQIIIYDPAVHPTPTGDCKIRFQYQDHTPDLDLIPGYTVGVEGPDQTCGVQYYYHYDYPDGRTKDGPAMPFTGRQQGTPIAAEMAIEFNPIPAGDEDIIPNPPSGLAVTYDEPFAKLSWFNPTYDSQGFELEFIDGILIRCDGEAITDLVGAPVAPGEYMEYSYREQTTGQHDYEVRAYVGSQYSDPASIILAIPDRTDYADHDIGNVRFTVTDQGVCGFMDSGQTAGSGFHYGLTDPNWLFVGGLWVATDSTYTLNKDYVDDPYVDWKFWNDVEGPASVVSDQDYLASYDDAGHSFPKRLRVTQDSWAWGTQPYDDFAILQYTLTNDGQEDIVGLYAGHFMDWDIPVDSPWTNSGATHQSLRMVYMWEDENYPYVGVALLDTTVAPVPVANLTLIHNPTYVYPNVYLLDTDRYLFLSAGDPAHVVPVSTQPDDWGTLVSAGPFDLAHGESETLAFAIVGGDDYADLVSNAGRAHEIYTAQATHVTEEPTPPASLRLVQNRPNPFNPTTSIHYELPRTAHVTLSVYHASGRLVRTLLDCEVAAGTHIATWDGRSNSGDQVSSGVYFYRLQVGDWSDTRKMVLLK